MSTKIQTCPHCGKSVVVHTNMEIRQEIIKRIDAYFPPAGMCPRKSGDINAIRRVIGLLDKNLVGYESPIHEESYKKAIAFLDYILPIKTD